MMLNTENRRWNILAWAVTALSGIGALAVVATQTWLAVPRIVIMIVMLLLLAAMGVMALLLRGVARVEVEGPPAITLAVALLIAGGALSVVNGVDALMRLDVLSIDTEAMMPAMTPLVGVMQWLQIVFGLLSGVVLVRLGWMLLAEGFTRRGIVRWSLLVPVVWMWLTLANYEMSYNSMVGIVDGFFTLAMYIFEMLFLFCFARYIAGVGQMRMGTLLFCAGGAALCSLATPLVRLLQQLLQTNETVSMGGITDAVVGLLALMVCLSLAQGIPSVASVEEDEEEEDAWSEESIDLSNVEFIEESDEEEDEVMEEIPE